MHTRTWELTSFQGTLSNTRHQDVDCWKSASAWKPQLSAWRVLESLYNLFVGSTSEAFEMVFMKDEGPFCLLLRGEQPPVKDTLWFKEAGWTKEAIANGKHLYWSLIPGEALVIRNHKGWLACWKKTMCVFLLGTHFLMMRYGELGLL